MFLCEPMRVAAHEAGERLPLQTDAHLLRTLATSPASDALKNVCQNLSFDNTAADYRMISNLKAR